MSTSDANDPAFRKILSLARLVQELWRALWIKPRPEKDTVTHIDFGTIVVRPARKNGSEAGGYLGDEMFVAIDEDAEPGDMVCQLDGGGFKVLVPKQ